MSTEIAKAYVQIIPSAEGITGGIEKAIKPEATSAGSSAGLALAKSMGPAIIAGIAALGIGKAIASAVSSSISSGSEFQTSLAKLGTVADTSQKSISSFSSEIRTMSDEMGISQSALAESAYSVISATGDTANALDLVAQSVKLAKAGFTDTDSATSVLTATMNAYCMSAEDAEHISDSLITTQNLGVTTVADLSSNMGRAIATASAYGVSLENLESAYIATTKGGISTAESTTYLSSMLSELGDSGSDVSAILQEKTGQSFSELMESGTSLGDVLGTLMDSVDGDSAAFINLWSSQEAGKAANAVVNQGIETFNANLETLQNTTGTTEDAYNQMMDTFESNSAVLKTNLQNIGIEFFNNIYPALDSCIQKAKEFVEGMDTSALSAKIEEVANQFGDWVTSLDSDAIISGINGILDAVVGVITTIQGIISFIQYIGSCVSAIVELIGAGISWLGGVLESGLGLVENGCEAIHDKIDGFMQKIPLIGDAWRTMGEYQFETCDEVATATEDAASRSEAAVNSSLDSVSANAGASLDELKANVDSACAEASSAVTNVQDASVETVTATNEQMSQLSASAQEALNVVSSTESSLASLSGNMSTAMTTLQTSVQTAMTASKTQMQSGWNSIKTTTTNTLNTLRSSVQTGFNAINSAVKVSMTAMTQSVTNAMNNAKTAVQNGVNAMRAALNVTMPTPYIKMPHITVSGSFSIEKGTAPTFSVAWYDRGGIFDRPSIIGVGEKRPEFVGALDDLRRIVRDESGTDPQTVNRLISEIRSLGDRIESMEVTLDSKKTIGALTPGIDRA